MKKTKILVCCHKEDIRAAEAPYLPIHVGKSISKFELGIQADNEGENISEKNGSYCELTGMYWAWKNLKDVEVVGLCHYRRYFDFHNQCRKIFPSTSFATEQFKSLDLSIPEHMIDNMKEGDIIMAEPVTYQSNLFQDYCCMHISDDFRVVQDIFEKEQNAEMLRAFYETMYLNGDLSHYNMFVMTWKDFDKYCKWLFDILSKVELRTDISNYSPVQKRIYGYIAERLLNVYVKANNMNVTRKKVIFVGGEQSKESSVKYLARKYRSKLGVKLTNSSKKFYENFVNQHYHNRK